jgi:hypothetical protein
LILFAPPKRFDMAHHLSVETPPSLYLSPASLLPECFDPILYDDEDLASH